MTMTAERKVALVKEYATKPGDTGSPEVQVAILTERINGLTVLLRGWASARPSSDAVSVLGGVLLPSACSSWHGGGCSRLDRFTSKPVPGPGTS